MSAIDGVTGTPKVEEALRQCDKPGGKKLDLSGCGLLELPAVVIDKYSETLEFLNLGHNQLSRLPHDFHRLVHSLSDHWL